MRSSPLKYEGNSKSYPIVLRIENATRKDIQLRELFHNDYMTFLRQVNRAIALVSNCTMFMRVV